MVTIQACKYPYRQTNEMKLCQYGKCVNMKYEQAVHTELQDKLDYKLEHLSPCCFPLQPIIGIKSLISTTFN